MPILQLLKKYWIGLLLVVVVIIAGVFAGSKLNGNKYANPDEKELAQSYEKLFNATQKGENIKVYAPKKKDSRIKQIKGPTYDAASPTMGAILTTVQGKLDFEKLQIAVSKPFELVKENQALLFYSLKGDVVAKELITSIDGSNPDTIIASYTDHHIQYINKAALEQSGDIVVKEVGPIKRVSNQGIIEENGEHFIYVAKAMKDENGRTVILYNGQVIAAEVHKVPIDIQISDDWNTQASRNIHKADLIILNPNSDLHDGKLVKLRILKFKDETSSITAQVKATMRQQAVIATREELKKLLEQCSLAQAAQAKVLAEQGDSVTRGSCGSNSGGSSCGGGVTTDTAEQHSDVDPYELLGIEKTLPENMSTPVPSE
ncbi:MAG: hypothetical protein HRT94_02450 [Alphaproteobacteria bacterium]|nr:hypothetical protein [Alphaproteobacteria bacterium]